MKIYQILTLATITLSLFSCKNNPKIAEEINDTRLVEKVDKNTGIISLSNYEYSDTIRINGDLYRYAFAFENVDSLPHITNAQGLEYLDNTVSLTITKDDDTIVTKKKFYKSSFKSYVPEELWNGSGLVGFSFNFVRQEHDAFYFIATIGDPDETSDISYPLEVRITTNGGMTIAKAQNLDTEPLREGLNIDPKEDDGV